MLKYRLKVHHSSLDLRVWKDEDLKSTLKNVQTDLSILNLVYADDSLVVNALVKMNNKGAMRVKGYSNTTYGCKISTNVG